MIWMSVYVIADTFFIAAALGADGLAALNISIISFTLVHSFGLMLGLGGGAVFSIARGRGESGGDVLAHALVMGAAAALGFAAVGVFLTGDIARVLGADDVILPMVSDYIRTILLFSPFLILKNILLSFVRNDGKPRLAMAGTFTGAVSNIVLDYVFLFPLGLGMFGAALATGLSLIFSIAVLWGGFRIRRCRLRLRRAWEIVSLGASAFVNEAGVAVALVVFNLVILGLAGNIGVAAYGIVMNLAIVVLSVFSGIAVGVQPLVSRWHGSGDAAFVRAVLRYALVTVGVLALAVYAAVFAFAPAVVGIFNGEGDVLLARLAEDGLRVYFIGLIFAGVNIVLAAFFSASARPRIALAIAVLRGFVLIVPMLLVLSRFMGMDGVWLSFVVTEAAVFTALLFLHLVLRLQTLRRSSFRAK